MESTVTGIPNLGNSCLNCLCREIQAHGRGTDIKPDDPFGPAAGQPNERLRQTQAESIVESCGRGGTQECSFLLPEQALALVKTLWNLCNINPARRRT